jgi:hypothetical protein
VLTVLRCCASGVIAIAFCTHFLIAFANAQTSTIAETVRQLKTVEVADFPPTDVPAAARPLLKQLKHQLRDLIAETLNEHHHRQRSPDETRAAILDRLRSLGVILKPIVPGVQRYDPELDKYGYIRDIRIAEAPEVKNLLVAVTTLQIPCGSDSSLYIFMRKDSGWELVLALEANDYAEIKGAHGSFSYRLSPTGGAKDWFVVAVNINPWCTSAWQSIRYQVLRPGSAAYEPKVLLTRRESVYLGEDEVYKLKARRDGFRLDFFGYQLLDSDQSVRVHVANYQVSGNEVTRVPPLALVPQDFLDEWIELPWAEASRWTESANLSEMERWHDKLQALGPSGPALGFVQPCPPGRMASRWLVALGLDPKTRPEGLPSTLYFAVGKKQGDFHVTGVSAERPPGCPGSAPAVFPPVRKLP